MNESDKKPLIANGMSTNVAVHANSMTPMMSHSGNPANGQMSHLTSPAMLSPATPMSIMSPQSAVSMMSPPISGNSQPMTNPNVDLSSISSHVVNSTARAPVDPMVLSPSLSMLSPVKQEEIVSKSSCQGQSMQFVQPNSAGQQQFEWQEGSRTQTGSNYGVNSTQASMSVGNEQARHQHQVYYENSNAYPTNTYCQANATNQWNNQYPQGKLDIFHLFGELLLIGVCLSLHRFLLSVECLPKPGTVVQPTAMVPVRAIPENESVLPESRVTASIFSFWAAICPQRGAVQSG